MKKIKNTLIVLIVLAILLSCCACDNPGVDGLSENKDGSYAVSFVCGIHHNFPFKGALYNSEVKDSIYNVAYEYGSLSIYVSDSRSSLMYSTRLEEPDEMIDNEKRKQIASQAEEAVLDAFATNQFVAQAEEVDILQTIILASESLKASGSEKKTLYIIDSGLSTSGVLNFTENNVIEMDPDDVVEMVEEKHSIPNLSGIDVKWIGFGQVNGEQQTLGAEYTYKLEMIWKAILQRGGAIIDENTIRKDALQDISEDVDLPSVSTVPIVINPISFQNSNSDVIEHEEKNTESPFTGAEIVGFGEDTNVKFRTNTADYYDDAEAAKELVFAAKYLGESTNAKLYIVGTTATSGSQESCKKLSMERAETVKRTIMQLDSRVKDEQMIILGLGYDGFSLRTRDVINGKLVEKYAKKNRAVFIIGENAPVVDEIRALTE